MVVGGMVNNSPLRVTELIPLNSLAAAALAEGSCSAPGPMNKERATAALLKLPNGTIIACTGADSSCETYEGSSSSWTISNANTGTTGNRSFFPSAQMDEKTMWIGRKYKNYFTCGRTQRGIKR